MTEWASVVCHTCVLLPLITVKGISAKRVWYKSLLVQVQVLHYLFSLQTTTSLTVLKDHN